MTQYESHFRSLLYTSKETKINEKKIFHIFNIGIIRLLFNSFVYRFILLVIRKKKTNPAYGRHQISCCVLIILLIPQILRKKKKKKAHQKGMCHMSPAPCYLIPATGPPLNCMQPKGLVMRRQEGWWFKISNQNKNLYCHFISYLDN